MTDRTTDPQLDSTKDENAEKDESVVEKAKDKLSEMVDAPDGADYDESKTNPVTGQRRR